MKEVTYKGNTEDRAVTQLRVGGVRYPKDRAVLVTDDEAKQLDGLPKNQKYDTADAKKDSDVARAYGSGSKSDDDEAALAASDTGGPGGSGVSPGTAPTTPAATPPAA